jgi:hypothetical protein
VFGNETETKRKRNGNETETKRKRNGNETETKIFFFSSFFFVIFVPPPQRFEGSRLTLSEGGPAQARRGGVNKAKAPVLF